MADDGSTAENSTDTPPSGGEDDRSLENMEDLLKQAEEELATEASQAPATDEEPEDLQLEELEDAREFEEPEGIDLLHDVDLDLRIELGKTHMQLEEVLHLRSGSVVALDRLAGDPVDIIVNDRLIARGEVLVLNENFCVRVTELVSGAAP